MYFLRLENLEKENVDLKFELDDEVRIHSMEIEKLSNQNQNTLKKYNTFFFFHPLDKLINFLHNEYKLLKSLLIVIDVKK